MLIAKKGQYNCGFCAATDGVKPCHTCLLPRLVRALTSISEDTFSMKSRWRDAYNKRVNEIEELREEVEKLKRKG